MTTGDNGKMNSPRLYPFLAAIAIITGLVLIVLAAIATDALITLIAGVIVLGLIAIGLATIGVKLFSRYTDAVLKRKSLEYEHVQSMARLGYLPTGDKYQPMRAEIAAPKQAAQQPAGIDPLCGAAMHLLHATIDHPDYGPQSKKILTADDAQICGAFPDRNDRQEAVDWLADKKYVYTINDRGKENGVYCKGNKTVLNTLCDMEVNLLPVASTPPPQNRSRG